MRLPFNTSKLGLPLLALLYSAPVLVIEAWALKNQPARICVAVFVTFILIAVLFAVVVRTWRRFFLWQWPLFALSTVFVSYTLIFGMPPAHTLAMIVVNTTSEEVFGFFQLAKGNWLIAALAATVALYLWLVAKLRDRPIFHDGMRRATPYLVGAMLASTAYLGADASDLIDGIALNPAAGSLIFIGGWLPMVHAEMHGSRVKKIAYSAHRTGGEEVHILIIGESERRESWAAYGYARPDTPYMNKLKSEAIFLDNAMSDANLTDWAVPIILTGATPEEYSFKTIRGNLIDLANEAGYDTAWLDNQDIQMATAIGVTAAHTVNPADFEADINGRHTLDQVLLPAYRREIDRNGASRFIAIHMMGAHWEYFRRYPPGFQRFGTARKLSVLSIFYGDSKTFADVVDSYDNAVLYTDWFLNQIIEEARRLKVPATVMFLSDHGEDLQLLDGTAGHGAPAYTPHAFEIPAFVWVNAAYRDAHPGLVHAMQRNASAAFRSHNVFETERELMGIVWPGARDDRSLASERFVPDAAMKYVAGGVLVDPPKAPERPPAAASLGRRAAQ